MIHFSRFFAFVLSAAASLTFAANFGPAGFIYEENQVPPYTTSDPLRCQDGSLVKDVQTWENKRRPELLEIFSREVYGRTPGGRLAGMHWEETSVDRAALGGQAVRREITLWFTENKNGPKARLLIYQPPGNAGKHAPWPVFLGLNFFGNQSVANDPAITLSPAWMRPSAEFHVVENRATEKTRGVHAGRWSIETVVARGYATATLYCGDLSEDRSEGLVRDVGALFKTKAVNERAPDEWGAIGIWAWGLSRIMDYFENDPELDASRVAVHGHSRLGKAALWAGAQDPRFALVISNNSGCGGAALSKRIFGETVQRINGSFPFWFAVNFRNYNGREDKLPIDQHELIGLIAPRPVYVASAQEDRWADPKGEYLGAKLSEPVYALYGKTGLGVKEMPALHYPVHGDGLAYHLRAGKHDINTYDWTRYLDYADRVLKKP
ncbi:MAG TPA: acetylxylan esterase [Opitutaceae bacterium]|nr:acetylxylan esterase [Opitutaceae bacterium]